MVNNYGRKKKAIDIELILHSCAIYCIKIGGYEELDETFGSLSRNALWIHILQIK